MGGRGASSASGAGKGTGVITKRPEPGGYAYYVTGKRKTISHYDEDGNYHKKGIVEYEKFHARCSTLEEAKRQAKRAGLKVVVI